MEAHRAADSIGERDFEPRETPLRFMWIGGVFLLVAIVLWFGAVLDAGLSTCPDNPTIDFSAAPHGVSVWPVGPLCLGPNAGTAQAEPDYVRETAQWLEPALGTLGLLAVLAPVSAYLISRRRSRR